MQGCSFHRLQGALAFKRHTQPQTSDCMLCAVMLLQDAGVSATPGPEKKRSRWDETPANVSAAGGFGATPAAGAGLPFGATPAFTPGMVAGEQLVLLGGGVVICCRAARCWLTGSSIACCSAVLCFDSSLVKVE